MVFLWSIAWWIVVASLVVLYILPSLLLFGDLLHSTLQQEWLCNIGVPLPPHHLNKLVLTCKWHRCSIHASLFWWSIGRYLDSTWHSRTQDTFVRILVQQRIHSKEDAVRSGVKIWYPKRWKLYQDMQLLVSPSQQWLILTTLHSLPCWLYYHYTPPVPPFCLLSRLLL